VCVWVLVGWFCFCLGVMVVFGMEGRGCVCVVCVLGGGEGGGLNAPV
jgi:hypothetical protein